MTTSSRVRQPYLPASRPRSAKAVLYVDLDGVLHHEGVVYDPRRGVYMSEVLAPGRALFEWADILDDLLEPHPDVALVLSSSWCARIGYAATLKRLSTGLRARFIGATYHRKVHGADPWTKSDFLNMSRGEQVCADVERRQPNCWAALDDDAEHWPADVLKNLIECDGRRGLSDLSVQLKLEAWLIDACLKSRPQWRR